MMELVLCCIYRRALHGLELALCCIYRRALYSLELALCCVYRHALHGGLELALCCVYRRALHGLELALCCIYRRALYSLELALCCVYRHALHGLELKLHRINEDIDLKTASLQLDKMCLASRLKLKTGGTVDTLNATDRNMALTGAVRERSMIISY